MITKKCACQKSYTSIIMTSITWAGPRCVQELATFLGPQNRTQGRCENYSAHIQCHCFHCSKHLRHFSFQTQGHSNKHPILAPVLDLYFTKCTCTGQSFRRNWIGFVLNTKVASKIGTVLKYFIMFKTFHNGRGSS